MATEGDAEGQVLVNHPRFAAGFVTVVVEEVAFYRITLCVCVNVSFFAQ